MSDEQTKMVALGFIRASRAVSGYVDNIDVMYRTVFDHVNNINGERGQEAVEMVRERLRLELTQEVASLETMLAEIYSQTFTMQELAEMQRFFATPVGQKMVKATPIITGDFTKRTEGFQQRMANEVIPDIQQNLREKGFAV